jgi:hypothetical protein
MAGMASCVRCGGELPATARFCPTCGRPVAPQGGPAAPPHPPPIWAGLRLPAWVTGDWPLVALGAAVLLGAVFALSALVGMVAAVAVSGSVDALPCGAGVGAHLGFAAFGATTEVACRSTTGAALGLSFLPLFWAFTGGLATEAALRFAWPRLVDDRRRRIAYAAKLALVTGVVLGLIAGMVNGGNPRGPSSFGSNLNGGEVWFYSSVLTWFWAWLALRRRAVRVVEAPADAVVRYRPFKRMAAEGALAFGLLATGLAVVGLLFGLAVADSGADRLGIVIGFPVVGFSLGAGLADGAMGAALAGVRGHSSLLHFGLPAHPESGAAPLWLFVVVLIAPAVVALTVWRRLHRDRPVDEQRALATGGTVAAGFAGAAWLAALVGRVTLIAYVGPNRAGGWFSAPPAEVRRSVHGAAIIARADPGSVLGLSLMWGLIGGLGAAVVWAVRHGARWPVVASADADLSAAGPASAAGPTSPAAGPTAWLLPETEPESTAAGASSPTSAAAGPSGPHGDGPSGPGATGPASGIRSGAAPPSATGAGSDRPAGAGSPTPEEDQGAGGPEERPGKP